MTLSRSAAAVLGGGGFGLWMNNLGAAIFMGILILIAVQALEALQKIADK